METGGGYRFGKGLRGPPQNKSEPKNPVWACDPLGWPVWSLRAALDRQVSGEGGVVQTLPHSGSESDPKSVRVI